MKLILKDYENYVCKMARSFHKRNSHVDYDDLVQSGWLGLLEAYNKFDEKFNVKFLTYASFYIKKHIRETIHKNTVVEFPRDLTRIFFRLEKARNEIQYKDRLEATPELLSKKTGISINKIKKYEVYFNGFNPCYNVDELLTPEMDDVNFETIKTVLDRLTDKQREIFLDRVEGKHLIEIGNEHNLTAERIRQILLPIVKKIKRKINEL